MLVRLGPENETWAVKVCGIIPMMMRGRQMHGWVRAAPEAYGNDALRHRLLNAALEFNRLAKRKDRRVLPTLIEMLSEPEPTDRAIETASLMLGMEQDETEMTANDFISALRLRFGQ